MTLTGRVALVSTAVVLTCITVVASIVYALEARDLRGRVDESLAQYASSVSERLVSTGDVDEVLRGGPLDVSTTYAQVVLADGEVIPLSSPRALLPVDGRTGALARGEGDRFFSDVDVDGSHVRTLAVPTPNGALQVARAVDDVDLLLLRRIGLVALAGGFGVALALVVGRSVARASLRPVRRLAAGAESIASTRNFNGRLPMAGDDEVARLAGSINTLLDALGDSLRRQRRLVVDASHELKTPLTGLRTELDLISRNGTVPDTDRAQVAVADLVSAVDDLVELARDEPTVSVRDDVALDEVVRECVEWTLRHHRDARVEVNLEPLTVHAVRSQVARAVGNLLDNALKHSQAGSPVEVTLRAGALTVRDHGPGFEEADLPHVFDRFYRAPNARSLPGAGLGLAIVRKVADEHGWDVRAENAPGGGGLLVLDTTGRISTGPLMPHSSSSHVDAVDRETANYSTQEGVMRRSRPKITYYRLAAAGLGAVAVAGVVAIPALGQQDTAEMDTLRGMLDTCGDGHCIDGQPVDFGPSWGLGETAAEHDLDGDGSVESLADEIAGLVGTDVLLEVDPGAREADVLVVNGLPYRSADRPPPWLADGSERPSGGDDREGVSTGPRHDGVRLFDIAGELQRCGSGYCVGEEVLDFGPMWWIQTTQAPEDLDGDGTVETLADEFVGLVGSHIVAEAERGRDAADVHTLNGVRYRGEMDGPPAWARGPAGAGGPPSSGDEDRAGG